MHKVLLPLKIGTSVSSLLAGCFLLSPGNGINNHSAKRYTEGLFMQPSEKKRHLEDST